MKTTIIKIGIVTLAVTILSLSNYAFPITKSKIANTGVLTTKCTLSNYEMAIAVVYNLEEDEFVNDITLNTNLVSAKYNYSKAFNKDFNFEEESYIDDI